MPVSASSGFQFLTGVNINRNLLHKIIMEIIELKDEQGKPRGRSVVFGVLFKS